MSFLGHADPEISDAIGMETKRIAWLIVKLVTNIGDNSIRSQVRQEVSQMCQRFTVPWIDD